MYEFQMATLETLAIALDADDSLWEGDIQGVYSQGGIGD